METDASILGLRAVLTQEQKDKSEHPIAYASHSLSFAEKNNYSITDHELETLAVIWTFSHYRAYVYIWGNTNP